MITATKDEKYLLYIAACLLVVFLLSLTGCTSTGASMGATAGAKTKEGAATGAAVGTAVGLVYRLAVGGDDPIGSMQAGAAVGAAAGATAGYIADQQTKKDKQ
jgi:hypothetical protein